MTEIPDSMKAELQAWSGGEGIDLEGWVGCMGTFSLAVGYAAVFCPDFVEFEDYIFVGSDVSDHVIHNVRGFAGRAGAAGLVGATPIIVLYGATTPSGSNWLVTAAGLQLVGAISALMFRRVWSNGAVTETVG